MTDRQEEIFNKVTRYVKGLPLDEMENIKRALTRPYSIIEQEPAGVTVEFMTITDLKLIRMSIVIVLPWIRLEHTENLERYLGVEVKNGVIYENENLNSKKIPVPGHEQEFPAKWMWI